MLPSGFGFRTNRAGPTSTKLVPLELALIAEVAGADSAAAADVLGRLVDKSLVIVVGILPADLLLIDMSRTRIVDGAAQLAVGDLVQLGGRPRVPV